MTRIARIEAPPQVAARDADRRAALSGLTIVMYHYVRPIARSDWPGIKGRELRDFDGQLDYVGRHFTVVSGADVVRAADGLAPLPPRACLLTFDDGLRDHVDHVFPRLASRGWSGAFFPPVASALQQQVLDVHKIQFILAATPEPASLVRRVLARVAEWAREVEIESWETLYARLAAASRFDPPEVVFLKRALQRELPGPVREAITAELFADHVNADEAAFARMLYAGEDEWRTMADAGMEIGGHGDRHLWLASLDEAGQRRELDRTVAFVRAVNRGRPEPWTMCYPYGSFDDATVALSQERGARLGLTTRVSVVQALDDVMRLPRLDTNDLPVVADAPAPAPVSAHAAEGVPADDPVTRHVA